jgi:hypothetical protein
MTDPFGQVRSRVCQLAVMVSVTVIGYMTGSSGHGHASAANIADMYVHVIEERQWRNTSESAFYLHRVQCIIAREGAGIGICMVRSKSLLRHAARLQAKRNPIELNGTSHPSV